MFDQRAPALHVVLHVDLEGEGSRERVERPAGIDHDLLEEIGVRAVEAADGGREVEPLGLAEALGGRARDGRRAGGREIQRGDAGRAARREPHDGFAGLHLRAVHEVDVAVRGQRDLEAVAVDLGSARHAAPGEDRPVRCEARADAAAPRRVEIGEEGRDAGRAGEEASHASIRGAGVGRHEREVAVGVDEDPAVARAVEGEGEGQIHRLRVVASQAEGGARRFEGQREPRQRVGAARAGREPQGRPVEVEGIPPRHQVPGVLEDGHAVAVDVAGGRGRRPHASRLRPVLVQRPQVAGAHRPRPALRRRGAGATPARGGEERERRG